MLKMFSRVSAVKCHEISALIVVARLPSAFSRLTVFDDLVPLRLVLKPLIVSVSTVVGGIFKMAPLVVILAAWEVLRTSNTGEKAEALVRSFL